MYKQMIWDVTSKCNLKCRHCYAAEKYDSPCRPNDLTTGQAKQMLEQIKMLGFKNVLLLGGEPLIRKDILEVISYARKIGLDIMINTNGTFLSPNMCYELLKRGVKEISVSFQGITASTHDLVAGKGSFSASLMGLKNLVAAKEMVCSDVFIGIQVTVMKPAKNEMDKLIDFVLENGAGGLAVGFLDDNGRAHSNFDDLFISSPEYLDILETITESLVKNNERINSDLIFQINAKQIMIKYLSHKYGVDIQANATGYLCAAGDRVMVIENDGTITPCGTANNQRMSEKALEEKRYVLQKLNVFDFFTESELMQTPFFSTFRKYKNESKKINSTCKMCEYNASCQVCPLLHEKSIEQCIEACRRYDIYLDTILESSVRPIDDKLSSVEYDANETANDVIIHMLIGEKVSEIVKFVANKYDVTYDTAKKDILEFHRILRINGLL